MAINDYLPSSDNKIVNAGASILKNEFNLEKDLEIVVYDQFRDGLVFKPFLTGNVEISYDWKGAPGKLQFSVLLVEEKAGKGINYILEGNQVMVRYKGVSIFLGFVFTRKIDKKDVMQITCYDQLRYLKNKWYYKFNNVSASGIIKEIAKDFGIVTGDIEETEYIFKTRTEENKTLFDIILTTLELTTQQTKKKYILYDDAGKLCLKEEEKMKIEDLILDENSGEKFSYSSDIDKDTYNFITLYYDNKDTGKKELYQVKDSVNIRRWGYLVLYDSIPEGVNGQEKAEAMMALYNYPKRSYSLSKVFGDIRVRGGSGVLVKMKMAELNILNYMIVSSVKHIFKHEEYFMDINLIKTFTREEEMEMGNNTGNTNSGQNIPQGGIS